MMVTTALLILAAIVTLPAAQARGAADGADEVRRLEAGEVLITAHEVPGRSVPRVEARALVRAAPEKIWAVIEDVPHYKDWMPRILESQVLSREGNKVVSRIKFDMPFPFSDLWSETEAVHTALPGRRYKRAWHLRSGDFRENTGSWTLEPYGDEHSTLVTYEILSEPNVPLPSFIIERAQRTTLPELFVRLCARVE